MAIFGKSKKAKPSTPPRPQEQPRPEAQPQPQPSVQQQSHSTAPFYQQPHGTQIVLTPQQSWYYEPRRTASQAQYPTRPQGWLIAPVHQQPSLSPPLRHASTSQNFLPQRPPRPQPSCQKLTKLNLFSVNNLLISEVPECVPGARIINNGLTPLHMQGTQYLNQSAALCDVIASKLNQVITLMDSERFHGDEQDMVVQQPQSGLQSEEHPPNESRALGKGKGKGLASGSTSTLTSTNYFSKVYLYTNSRLPPNLPPLKLYMPTFPLLCLAAQYSERVYTRPTGQEREAHVDADWKMGTKAMVIKSVPMDDMNIIVIGIRGTQTFMDWAVNLNSAPAAPDGFLDDPGNFCHAGFLTVARKMIKPIATRLRHLLQEDPSRSKCSLVITGHSAGGAVAALLYSHMHSTTREVQSELNLLRSRFKRVHCVTFGAPPVSLLPLTKSANPLLRKSLFLSFVNEGDPVVRADKPYIKSLLDLYASPAPNQNSFKPISSNLGATTSNLALSKPSKSEPLQSEIFQSPHIWPIPESTLSNAGRIILLRSAEAPQIGGKNKKNKVVVPDRMNEGIVAQVISDELLRGVVWGDPVMHMMKLYSRRIEILATNAVMGRS